MNDIIYTVRFYPELKNYLSDNTKDYSVPLDQYEDSYKTVPVAEKIKFLFFNMLFNNIEDYECETFLEFHLNNYRYDKKDFLRILEWDLDEIFDRFEIPGREKRLIYFNPSTGSTRWDISKLILKEIMPFFEPYDYEKYLIYKRRYKETKHWIKNKKEELENVMQNLEVQGENHLLKIPTKATSGEILDFWLKLQSNNEKGEPYWKDRQEIEHFVYQNFDVFPGVNEIRLFNPNMNKSELSQVTWIFYHTYRMSKTKKQYEMLLMQNFIKFKDDKNVYSNIKDQNNAHLKKLYK